MNEIHRMIQVLLDMAEYAETEDAEKINDFFIHSAGMGCLSFSRRIRRGVIKTIELINDYHIVKERNKYLESNLHDYEEFSQNVLGCDTIDCDFFTEDAKAKISALVKEIRKEWLDDEDSN